MINEEIKVLLNVGNKVYFIMIYRMMGL